MPISLRVPRMPCEWLCILVRVVLLESAQQRLRRGMREFETRHMSVFEQRTIVGADNTKEPADA